MIFPSKRWHKLFKEVSSGDRDGKFLAARWEMRQPKSISDFRRLNRRWYQVQRRALCNSTRAIIEPEFFAARGISSIEKSISINSSWKFAFKRCAQRSNIYVLLFILCCRCHIRLTMRNSNWKRYALDLSQFVGCFYPHRFCVCSASGFRETLPDALLS